jgi:hypothetical protein
VFIVKPPTKIEVDDEFWFEDEASDDVLTLLFNSRMTFKKMKRTLTKIDS